MNILTDVRKRLRREKKDGLLDDIARDFLADFEHMKHANDLYPMVINLLLGIRYRLRKEKNYDFADYIRKRLLESNIMVDDQESVSTYRIEVK